MFKRRLVLFIALVLVLAATLALRLAWLQIVQGKTYLEKTRNAYQPKTTWLHTARAAILDVKGKELAVVRASYDLCFHYQMTRLFDERFWIYEQEKYRRQRRNRRKSPSQIEQEVHAHFRDDLQQAEALLGELTRMFDVPRPDFVETMDRLNQDFFDLQSAWARRDWYRRRGLPCERLEIEGIQADLAERYPNANDRIHWIYSHRVREMNDPQRVLGAVSDEIALEVEATLTATEAPFVSIEVGQVRDYPQADAASHLIGQLRPVPVKALSGSIPPTFEDLCAYRPGDQRGTWGIELLYDVRLRGRRGWQYRDFQDQFIKDPVARVNGEEVKLTIDIELQKAIQNVLEGDNEFHRSFLGAAVVVDVPTGQIRAMVSVPSYDLNTFYHDEPYGRIRDDPNEPRLNRALSQHYSPGSTIKPIILLAALKENVVNSGTTFDCTPRDVRTPPRSVCYRSGHGRMNAYDAIKESCNFYFVRAGALMGAPAVLKWLDVAGFGRRMLAWPEDTPDLAWGAFRETEGYIQGLDEVWRDGRRQIIKREPTKSDLQFLAIGLRPLEGSVLQMANSMAVLARDGLMIPPYFVLPPPVTDFSQRLPASAGDFGLVRRAMKAVIYDRRGTAHSAFDPFPWPDGQVTIYAKTGTTSEDSVFSGFAEATDGASLALAVLVEDDGGGGGVAAPLGRDILKLCGQFGYLPGVPEETPDGAGL